MFTENKTRIRRLIGYESIKKMDLKKIFKGFKIY